MKAKIEVERSIIRKFGANVAVVYAIVQDADGAVTNTDIANELCISFPTAQKCLKALEQDGLIKAYGKAYGKI